MVLIVQFWWELLLGVYCEWSVFNPRKYCYQGRLLHENRGITARLDLWLWRTSHKGCTIRTVFYEGIFFWWRLWTVGWRRGCRNYPRRWRGWHWGGFLRDCGGGLRLPSGQPLACNPSHYRNHSRWWVELC